MANMSIDDNWDPYREAIRHAYLIQEKSLKDIRAFLKDAGFTVTVAQLEYKLKQWKFRRNLNKQAVTYIDYQVKKRKRDGKESDCVLSGVRLPPSKIQRAINRHSFVSTVDSLKMQQDFIFSPSHHVDTNMLVVSSLSPSTIHWTLRDTRGPSRFAAAIGIQMPEAYDGENLAIAEALVQGNGNTAKLAALRMLLFQISNNLTDLQYKYIATTIFETFREMAMSNHEWPLMLSAMRGPTSESINEKVFAAAVIHDQNDIAIPMLKAGASPTQSISHRWSGDNVPIDIAVVHNNTDLVVALLDAEAEVSHRTLSLAVQHCNSDLVLKLLRLNKTSDVSGLLLNKAIKYGDLPVIRHLIQEGDPFVYHSEYETPFGVTLAPTLIQVARYSRALDENNGTLNESDDRAEPPSVQIIRRLLRGEPTIHPEALTYAAGHGRDDILKILLEAGGDIDGLDDNGCSPLSLAALAQQAATVGLLLRLGARPDPVSSGANGGMIPSALHYASMTGNLEIVKLLLAAGADKNYTLNPQSWVSSPILKKIKHLKEDTLPSLQFPLSPLQLALTPLQLALTPLQFTTRSLQYPDLCPLQFDLYPLESALRRADAETGIALIKKGARLYGGVLCDAVCTGSQDLVTFLLDAGAAVGDDDDDIYTNPLSLAIFRNRTDIARLLMNRGWATRHGDTEHVRLLLEEGAHVNAPPYTPSDFIKDRLLSGIRYSVPRTALQAAVEIGHLELIKMLLEAGADVNAPAAPFMGATALQIAAIKGHLGLAKHLLEQGANIDAQAGDEYGRTALEGAAENGHIDMLCFLLQEGAKTTGSHRRQYLRAIRFAEAGNHHAAARLLQEEEKDDEEDEDDEEEKGYDILW
ncbi:hypothetical protein DL768_003347 [Monosporascus sp. mg162]|nr:hypothetical protein DL768_003347 [Monosporascus sp. mg162]